LRISPGRGSVEEEIFSNNATSSLAGFDAVADEIGAAIVVGMSSITTSTGSDAAGGNGEVIEGGEGLWEGPASGDCKEGSMGIVEVSILSRPVPAFFRQVLSIEQR